MKIILDSDGIEQSLQDLTQTISKDFEKDSEIGIIGIRSRGEILAQRLCQRLSASCNHPLSHGTLDITLYRDDLNDPHGHQPAVRTTDIDFDINNKIILLVDDVLYTGRSVRAALDALIDLGRPKAIRLAVLIERSGREFPIQADYIAQSLDIKEDQSVQVRLTESDGEDLVFVE